MFRAKIKPLALAVALAGLGPAMLSGRLAAATIQEDGGYQKQIVDLQTVVKDLSTDPASGEEFRYAALQHQLRRMIRSL